MKTSKSLLSALLLILCSCAQDIVHSQEEVSAPSQTQAEPAIKAGEIIVKFTDDMTQMLEADLASGNVVTRSSELNLLTEELGIRSMERVFPHAGEFEDRTREAGLHRWYKIKYSETTPVTKASADFAALPGIEKVEVVRRIVNTAYFNDPRFESQWHYVNTGGKEGMKAGADINVLPVWENYTTGSEKVIVAVVDGGIDYSHEDLAANYVGGRSFVDQYSKVVPHDHGTHVAGTIAAVNNNGIGVSGVAGGNAAQGIKGVGVLSCQIFAPNPANPNRDFSGDGAPAIKWGADNGAVISQNSWGYTYDTPEEQAAAKIPGHLAEAIDYFIANAGMKNGVQVGPMKGGVVIFAAGNSNRADDPIGKYDPVISVGSIGADFTRASYSNYGDWVDIAAPGGDAPYMVLSTVPGNGYATMQGTSMACPHVSGVAALIVSHFGGPGFTAETLRTKLIEGANKTALSKNAKIGYLLDAFGSMTYGGKIAPEAVSSFDVASRSNNLDLSWKVTSDKDDKKAYGFLLLASKDKALLQNMNYNSLPAGVVSATVMTGSAKVGEVVTGSVSGLDFDQEYHVAIVAFDYNSNWAAMSPIKSAVTGVNNPPVITASQQGPFVIKSHESLRVTYTVTDPDSHNVKVEYKQGSAADSYAALTGVHQVSIVGNAVEAGKYQAKLTATDSYGAASVELIEYEILENHAPVIIKEVEDKFFMKSGEQFSLNMDEYLDDPDGEQLKYTITVSDRSVLHLNPSENVLHATILSYGKAEVTVTASDARGETCILTFTVMVKDPSKPVELYPNPVSDYLNVRTLEPEPTRIVIASSTGQIVYDETSEVSAIDPASIDMTACAPGMYSVTVTFAGNEYKSVIVKL